MAIKPFTHPGLSRLCSQDQLHLLDSIDSLRSQGINHLISLPQIIVCGDQSSGKSSVLEAISGVSFPTKSNLCTRFPTELVLRKTAHSGVTVSIVPHPSRTELEKEALAGFHEVLNGFEGLPGLIEDAKTAMGISIHGKAFSKDILRVEVSGPDRPHLTIVDLPGLIHSETKQQSASDVLLIQDVVRGYMKQPRSIILAVVSAKNDYANQIVLNFARKADEAGYRTLGIITKPDTLLAGSESEATYVSLARNQEVKLHLGWHVVKNMDSETGEWTLEDRDVKETEFFSRGIWEELSGSALGVGNLRARLSKVLLQQISSELPSLMAEIELKSNICRNQLYKLGEPRATLAEQRLYLLHISQTFQSLIKAAVDGTYNDVFFEDARTEPGYQKRIRAVMQNLNSDFADRITRRGHHYQLTASKETWIPRGVIPITRDEYVNQIQDLMKSTRGRELPGTFNPLIVSDLFREQSSPWETITKKHIKNVWKAAKEFLRHVATHVADAATSKALFQKIFEPALNQLLENLEAKTAELLKPHQNSHPITYNHYFTETYQKVRNERKRNEFSKVLETFFGVSALAGRTRIDQLVDLGQLVENLVRDTEPNMNRLACSEVLDCMEAYYKVALKRFIDDIASEVVETQLISPLSDIFSPVAASALAADLVTRIAGESEENHAEREQLTKQLDVLMKGSEICKRFIGLRIGPDEKTKSALADLTNDDKGSDSDQSFSAISLDDNRARSERSVSPTSPQAAAPEVSDELPQADPYPVETSTEAEVEPKDEAVSTWGFSKFSSPSKTRSKKSKTVSKKAPLTKASPREPELEEDAFWNRG